MDIITLTKSIEDASAGLESSTVGELERQKFIAACTKLSEQLKKPHEIILETSTAARPPQSIAWHSANEIQSMKPAILRLAVEMRLFEIAAKAPEKTLTLSDLAKESKVDELLLLRVLRLLVGMSFFNEHPNQTYTLTHLGSHLIPGSPFHSWIVIDDTNQQAIAKLTSYFQERGFANPSDTKDTPFNHAFNTTETFFTWLSTKPQLGAAFNHVMQFAKMLRGPDWFEFFPVAEKLFSHPGKGQAMIIDIGGGTGGDLLNFKKQHPSYPGRLILQDLPEVLADAKTEELAAAGVELEAHSFLAPEPEAFHGATAYVIKNCLHDWPDAETKIILKHISDAMSKESTLLVCETSLSEQGVPFINAVFDWVMMIQFAGIDRMEKQWKGLFASVGLVIRQIWQSPVAKFTVVFELEKM